MLISDVFCRNIVGEHFEAFFVKRHPMLSPSLSFSDVNDTVLKFNIFRGNVYDLTYAHTSSPHKTQ